MNFLQKEKIMYTFKKIQLDGTTKIFHYSDKFIKDSAYPDKEKYFSSNNILWVNHKNDMTNEIDFEWIKTEEELKEE